MTVSPLRLLRVCQLDILLHPGKNPKTTHNRSDTNEKANETGIWMKRPTEARALDVSLGKPKLPTIVGAYVSNPRWGPLLQSVMRK